MTIEERIAEMLINNGLFPDQAASVIKLMKADRINEAMTERWSDNAEEYPEPLFTVLWDNTKHWALQYIDANCPKAWFRPLFAE